MMVGAYRHHYFERYRQIAHLIPHGASVLDLCCGPGILYTRHLREKSVAYTGLDFNERFVHRVIRAGALGQVRDLRSDEPLPPADYVVMQASLYHFLPDPLPIFRRMLNAARRAVIIAEPIHNLATSRLPVLSYLGAVMSNPGSGAQPNRFDEKSLDDFVRRSFDGSYSSALMPGGREKVYILNVPERPATPLPVPYPTSAISLYHD